MVEDPKLVPVGVIRWQHNFRRRLKFLRHAQPSDEAAHFVFCDFLKPLKVVELRLESGVCAVEPEALSNRAMEAKRPAKRIAKLGVSQLVLPWENFDSLRQAGSAFHRHLQPRDQVVDVDSAVPRNHRWGGKIQKGPPARRLSRAASTPS